MHLIHVWIVASAVPLLTAFSCQGTQSLQHREQQAFHDAETAPACQKPEMLSTLLPLFASHA